ncbi:hypothetical protein [Oceanirhabdus sp. W0125-5]|uniref:hypothetical protein n=1 Tax=Oceanirhabdus sp. W0125-5 TaxID=2999116 RepID=UPI0022F344AE|nr:hypothetical protein [Oceanirhabdus sp. W0125-5]WBW98404.1 hypothetical protein OW730_06455 [Oceanirhabdus sp. W0125-5]
MGDNLDKRDIEGKDKEIKDESINDEENKEENKDESFIDQENGDGALPEETRRDIVKVENELIVIESAEKNTFLRNIALLVNRDVIKKSIISSIIAIMISLILSFCISNFFMVGVNDFLEGKEDAFQEMNIKSDIRINSLDVYNMSYMNRGRLEFFIRNLDASGSISGGQVDIKISIMLLLLIPVIAFGICNIPLYRNKKSTRENVKYYVATSFFTSIFSSIFIILSIKNASFSDKVYLNIDFTSKFAYNFLGNIFNVFLVSILIQLIFSKIIKKETGNLFKRELVKETGDAIKGVLKDALLLATVLGFIIFFFATLNMKGNMFSNLNIMELIVLIPNIIAYVFLFLFGGAFRGEAFGNQFNINHLEVSKKVLNESPIKSEYIIIITILVIGYIGSSVIKNLSKLSKKNMFLKYGIFLISISGINVFIAYISSSYGKFTGDINKLIEIFKEVSVIKDTRLISRGVYLGSNILNALISTVILSGIAIIGHIFITKFLKKNEEIVKHKKKFTMIKWISVMVIALVAIGVLFLMRGERVFSSNALIQQEEIKLEFKELDKIRALTNKEFIILTNNTVYSINGKKVKKIYSTYSDIIDISVGIEGHVLILKAPKDMVLINKKGKEIYSDKVKMEYEFIKNNKLDDRVCWDYDQDIVIFKGETYRKINLKNGTISELKNSEMFNSEAQKHLNEIKSFIENNGEMKNFRIVQIDNKKEIMLVENINGGGYFIFNTKTMDGINVSQDIKFLLAEHEEEKK